MLAREADSTDDIDMSDRMTYNDNVRELGRRLGVLMERDELPSEYLKRLGAFILSKYTDEETWSAILRSSQVDDEEKFGLREPVRGLIAAVAYDLTGGGVWPRELKYAKDVTRPHSLVPNTTNYEDATRRRKVERFYPRHDDSDELLSVVGLFTDRPALEFLAAPATQGMLLQEYLDSAGRYVLSLNSDDEYFNSLKRLAGVATYPKERHDRSKLLDMDVGVLGRIKTDIKLREYDTGPILSRLLDLDYKSAGGKWSDVSPTRMTLDQCLEEAQVITGLTVNEAVLRGYLEPIRSALVIDFTRYFSDIKDKAD